MIEDTIVGLSASGFKVACQAAYTSVSTAYDELMHYTSASGLVGIVNNGRLWASHGSFLNDAQEMTHFFDVRLRDLAEDEIRIYAKQASKQSEIEHHISERGGIDKVALEESANFVSILKKATLEFNEPYIFSMSAPRTERIKASGLLSQWRGYGTDGGYAIVFDTTEVEELLHLENSAYHYQHLQWADVFYYGDESELQPSGEDIAEIEKTIRQGLAVLIRGGKAEEVEDFYQAISSASCLYKHWGFHEEREVRVIAIPAEREVAKLAEANGGAKPQKPINSFLRGGLPVPYIELFANLGESSGPTRLPIKRVVVGPSRDADLRRKAVQELLFANGYNCTVSCSDIPYVGR